MHKGLWTIKKHCKHVKLYFEYIYKQSIWISLSFWCLKQIMGNTRKNQFWNGCPTNLNSNKYHKYQYQPLYSNKININCNVCKNGYFCFTSHFISHFYFTSLFDFTSLNNYQLWNGFPTNLNSNKYQYQPLYPNKININCNVCNYKH